jgi:hypothetical protein
VACGKADRILIAANFGGRMPWTSDIDDEAG